MNNNLYSDKENEIINKTIDYVKTELSGEGSGHDYFHVERVYNTALKICENEGGNVFIISLAALLHDIDDWKFSSDNKTNTSKIETFLISAGTDITVIDAVTAIIKTLSYKGGVVDSTQHTIEGQIVQDADRLDAIGAIGIARTFAYGGNKNRTIYDPSIAPKVYDNLESVKNEKNHTINHFYEKLLKLKDLMNTNTGKTMAEKRHKFMEAFLKEFFEEIQ